jgi:hypothetical protein
MMRSARLLAVSLVVVLALPQPRAVAKPRALLPDLKMQLIDGTLTHSCAGPLLLRVNIGFEIKNIGAGTAVSPGPFYQWVLIRDIGGGPTVPEPMWSAGGPVQLLTKQSLTYLGQPLVRQVPVFASQVPIGFPIRYDARFAIIADPSKEILESNESNNEVGLGVRLDNKPTLTKVEGGRCN